MTNRDIGSRVSAVRQERGMTTTELARRVGISQAQISRLENGLQGFRSGTLLRIAKALGKPPFYFMMNDRQREAYERGKQQAGRGATFSQHRQRLRVTWAFCSTLCRAFLDFST